MDLAVGLAGLVVASVTLLILIAQERRERRHRPRPDWAFRRVGSATKEGSTTKWEVFEVANCGTAAATITEGRIFRAPQHLEEGYVLPKVLAADSSARVMLGPGFEDAWIRLTYSHPWQPGAIILWRPFDGASDLAAELTEQIVGARSRWMRPWRLFHKGPQFVGPGGLPMVRVSARHRNVAQRIATALAHPEAEPDNR